MSVFSLALKDNIRMMAEIEGEVVKIRHVTMHNATQIDEVNHSAFSSEFLGTGFYRYGIRNGSASVWKTKSSKLIWSGSLRIR
jgi:hypothetical protein